MGLSMPSRLPPHPPDGPNNQTDVSWLMEAAPFQGPMTPTQDAAGPDPGPAPTERPGGRAASRGLFWADCRCRLQYTV